MVCVPQPERVNRIPDKTVVLLSNANYTEQETTINHVELRSYQVTKDRHKGPYSLVTYFLETLEGDTIEDVLEEGYKGQNVLEDVAAYVTSHLTLQNLILQAIEKLKLTKKKDEKTYQDLLENLIKKMKQDGFLSSDKVEQVMRKTPRHLFVPENLQVEAYADGPLPTKDNQTISQPSVVARMTELLQVEKGNKVLEVGSGSGWQSAILSFLVGDTGRVYTIDKSSELAEFARKNHKKAGIAGVQVIEGDGTAGLAEYAPFDRIIVTASCKEIPSPLLEQLSENNGLLIAPVKESLVLIKKTPEGIREIKREFGYIFAPLVGKHS